MPALTERVGRIDASRMRDAMVDGKQLFQLRPFRDTKIDPAVSRSFVILLVTRALAFSILVMSVDILLGYTGLASLGQAGYLSVGAYATAILATNTSSIPLQDLRTTLQKPERLLGLHFFNPVSRLQLVEVVSHDGTDAGLLKKALAFVGAIDRLPLSVKSSPGFLVNRALTPYMLEAMVMLD